MEADSWDFRAVDVVSDITIEGQRVGNGCPSASFHELEGRMKRYLALAGLVPHRLLLRRVPALSGVSPHDLPPGRGAGPKDEGRVERPELRRPRDKHGDDEIGGTGPGFNEMLDQIQSRDEKLSRYREELEEGSGRRTVRIVHAKGRREAASIAKSQFLANIEP